MSLAWTDNAHPDLYLDADQYEARVGDGRIYTISHIREWLGGRFYGRKRYYVVAFHDGRGRGGFAMTILGRHNHLDTAKANAERHLSAAA